MTQRADARIGPLFVLTLCPYFGLKRLGVLWRDTNIRQWWKNACFFEAAPLLYGQFDIFWSMLAGECVMLPKE